MPENYKTTEACLFLISGGVLKFYVIADDIDEALEIAHERLGDDWIYTVKEMKHEVLIKKDNL